MTTTDAAPLSQARLAGRKILITGAASGIGRATAARFAEQGARLALLDVKDLSTWEAPPDDAVRLQADLLDRVALEQAVRTGAEQLGGLDGVVNCAGVAGSKPLDALTPDIWDRLIGVNLTAPYLVCRAALPYLRQAEAATIVNISSGAAILPVGTGSGAYAASKGGLISFSKALAAELAPKIRVNAITPGVVHTPMTAATVLGSMANPNDAPFVQQYALKRVADADELANAILFLTSAESSYVTGVTLAVDGGRTFH